MLDRALARLNGWALNTVQPQWVDYVVSNTMTDLNRKLNGFLWTYELKALVEQVLDEEAPGVKTFVLRPNQQWRGFQPGQHLEVFLPIGGETVRRCYSLSALTKGRFSITVKQTANGQASRWMHQTLRAGMTLRIGHPQGRFCHQGQAKLLFVCAGSGITPCHSMVSALLAQPESERPDMHLMAQFRGPSDVIFRETLQQWAQDGLKVTTALSGLTAEQVCLPNLAPRLDAAQLQKHCPDLLDRDIYLCGPNGFMVQMIEHLRALNVDLSRVHTERFAVAEPVACTGTAFEIAGTEVFFQHLNTRITLTEEDQGKTLLQLGLDHGVLLESGCCQGMCGTCKLTVHEGQVSGNALGKSVYLCTAYPVSRNLVLDA
jgi:ferredoxin-NADP reductase